MIELVDDMVKYKTLGDRLKFLRGKEKQKFYANLLGVTPETYCKYEKNIIDLGWKRLKRIAEHNGLSLDMLLLGL